MRIWIINLFSDLPGEGAGEGRFLTLCKVLAEMGHDVTWWTMNFHHRSKAVRSETAIRTAEQTLTTAENSGSIRIRTVPVPAYRKNISVERFFSHYRFGAKLRQVGKTVPAGERPERILASSPPLEAGTAALGLARSFRCPVAIDLTDLWPHTFARMLPGGTGFRRKLGHVVFAGQYAKARRLYRDADLVSAVSQEYLDEVNESAPGQRTHLCYIGGRLKYRARPDDGGRETGTGENETRTSSSPRQVDSPQARRPARISDGQPSTARPSSPKTVPSRFVYVGAMTGSYDLVTVLEAARRLWNEGKAFELHFAGDGPDEPALRKRAEAAGLGASCRFHGFLTADRLEALLADMDIGLNAIRPGLAITMPHKLSDYLCAGLPVINSLPGEAETLLRESGCGAFYTAGKSGTLADAMTNYLDPETLRRGRENAAALAARAFDRSTTYPEWARAVVSA